MAEGGQFPWKRQTIDSSRGPPADYSSLKQSLPDPPKGVEWQRDSATNEWRLVRTDSFDADKRKYTLQVGSTWNQHVGREQATLVPVPKQSLVQQETKQNDDVTTEDDKIAVENVDYVLHTVLPSDTLVGLCLRYKIKPTALRQVNKFSGSNLLLAPSKLYIPLCGGVTAINLQDKTCPEYKLHEFLAELPHLRQAEGRAYLELSDWNLQEALQNARDDELWEEGQERISRQEALQKQQAVAATQVGCARGCPCCRRAAADSRG